MKYCSNFWAKYIMDGENTNIDGSFIQKQYFIRFFFSFFILLSFDDSIEFVADMNMLFGFWYRFTEYQMIDKTFNHFPFMLCLLDNRSNRQRRIRRIKRRKKREVSVQRQYFWFEKWKINDLQIDYMWWRIPWKYMFGVALAVECCKSKQNDKQRADEEQKRYIKVINSVFLVTSFHVKKKKMKKNLSDIRGIRYSTRIFLRSCCSVLIWNSSVYELFANLFEYTHPNDWMRSNI